MTEGQRLNVARQLFAQWTGVTNPDLLAALWGNLAPEEREVWLTRAAEVPPGDGNA